ncbi:nSTAND1 domain-containing NTPase [Rhodococcus sp. JS3073]|uniref:nSTAND1 domain-containing NTPase n=1 Tax=Rhodococcus sp. JS3073 TaxID=3002901 RepID=UPI002285C370|nr:TIR domain-containing protein [Rhodococcus sp. JS3073]WAM19967.1 TIR domain-containing protein [Rhodococcus sp. JS3073]
MSRVFLSHSSRDSRAAIAVKRWLIEQEPGLAGEIFLDLDPHTGIRPGERWKQALQRASNRCEAVICLLSASWHSSRECTYEFRYAEALNKAIVCARLEPVPDTGITGDWQRCDLFGDGPTIEIVVDGGDPVVLTVDGLHRLLDGLRALGIGAEYFPWPPPADPERAPYRGWEPLDEADAAVFFGRDGQILRGLDAVRGMRVSGVESLLVILGPSGTGKSSFLRAGLLPRLRRDDRAFLPLNIVRPERAVLTGELGLAHSLYSLRAGLGLLQPQLGEIKAACLESDVDRLLAWFAEARQAARARLLDAPPEAPAPTLILPLDQGEELFSADAGPQAPRFLQILAALLRQDAEAAPGLIVAVTIRADRYEPLQTAPELAAVQSVVFDELKSMPPAEFKEVITGPARRATEAGRRLTIEPALVDRLLKDSSEGADTLPLLALTLQRLYCDFGDDGNLTVAEYETMGGMPRVVQTEIDLLLNPDPAARKAQLDTLHDAFIPWLATINPDNDQPMRRLARGSDLPPASSTLIDAFVEKRLLVRDIRNGQPVFEVALESLLRQWRELAEWLQTESRNLKDADILERAAADWRTNHRHDAWLLEGERLSEFERLATHVGFEDRLRSTREYLSASRQREDARQKEEKRRQEIELQAARDREHAAQALATEAQRHAVVLRKRSRALRIVLAVTAVIALVAVYGLVGAVQARNQAEERTNQATALRLISEAEQIVAGDRSGSDVQALQQVLAATELRERADGDALVNARIDGAAYDLVNGRRDQVRVIETPSPVDAVAVSPDSQQIASGSDNATVYLWNAGSGQQVGELHHEKYPVRGIAFSPNGKWIVTGGGDRNVRLWDAKTGDPIGAPMKHDEAVHSVDVSSDSRLIVSGGEDSTIRLWETSSGRPAIEPIRDGGGIVRSVAFNPAGDRIASGDEDGNLRVWDTSGRQVGEARTGTKVLSVAYNPAGDRIASGDLDGTIRIWDANGLPVDQTFATVGGVLNSIAFSPDGSQIISGGGASAVQIWDLATRQEIGDPTIINSGAVMGVAFSPNSRQIVSGSRDGTVHVWDPIAATPIQTSQGSIHAVAYGPDGQQVASAGEDGTVRTWDAKSAKPISSPFGDPSGGENAVLSVSYSPDGKRLVSAGKDGAVRLWDVTTRQAVVLPMVPPVGAPPTRPPPPPTEPHWVQSVAFNDDGSRIVSGGSDGAIRLWEVTGRPIGAIYGHAGVVRSVAFSPNGQQIVSGSWDFSIKMWSANNLSSFGNPMTESGMYEVYGVAFSPDGHRIVSGSYDSALRVWDADSQQKVAEIEGDNNMVWSVAFAHDGRWIASGSDNEVRLWDADTYEAVGQPFVGAQGLVRSVSFSPDDRQIVSASWDGLLRFWATPSDVNGALCGKLNSNMSRQQWDEWVSPSIDYAEVCRGLPIPPDE